MWSINVAHAAAMGAHVGKAATSPNWKAGCVRHASRIICLEEICFPRLNPADGFELYYLNVMAGPRRKLRLFPAPEVAWNLERDS